MYLNNVKQNVVVDYTSGTITDMTGITFQWGLGYRVDYSGSSEYFNGQIDEVAFFSRILSPAEISAYYKWAIGARNKSIFMIYSPITPVKARRAFFMQM